MGFQAMVFHSEQNGKPPEDSDQTFFKRSFYPLHDRGKRGGGRGSVVAGRRGQSSGLSSRKDLPLLLKVQSADNLQV